MGLSSDITRYGFLSCICMDMCTIVWPLEHCAIHIVTNEGIVDEGDYYRNY